MSDSLKIFLGIVILIGMTLYVVFISPFSALFFGLGDFVTKVIIAAALIAGAVALFIRIRKSRR